MPKSKKDNLDGKLLSPEEAAKKIPPEVDAKLQKLVKILAKDAARQWVNATSAEKEKIIKKLKS
ncbi:hypothetical protein [Kordiimonas aquimaris]|uniref:hypothetical protein n=1 Tax=Kordiimonas aquimaris TaxID=707591 RepID=UPI0021D31ADA|nr:hypothetical protein [Kordiimonas aquimaris]